MSSTALKDLPRTDRVAAHPILENMRRKLGSEAIVRLTRRVIDEARVAVRGGATAPTVDEAAAAVERAARAVLEKRARPIINATGVILHTNLGRAPLSTKAVLALAESAGGYASVEIELETGRRGGRGAFAE